MPNDENLPVGKAERAKAVVDLSKFIKTILKDDREMKWCGKSCDLAEIVHAVQYGSRIRDENGKVLNLKTLSKLVYEKLQCKLPKNLSSMNTKNVNRKTKLGFIDRYCIEMRKHDGSEKALMWKMVGLPEQCVNKQYTNNETGNVEYKETNTSLEFENENEARKVFRTLVESVKDASNRIAMMLKRYPTLATEM